MSGSKSCPKCGKNDKVEILSHNKINKVTKWYCYRCRLPFSTGGLTGQSRK